MSSFDRGSKGSPAGVSGILSQPGNSGKIQVVTYGWGLRSEGQFRQRWGRDTGGLVDYRFFRKVRNYSFDGVVAIGGTDPAPPEPSGWVGGQGQLVLQFHTGRTVTLSVVIDSFKIECPGDAGKEKNGEKWIVTGSCHVIGEPAYSGGWGEQPNDAESDPYDSRQYEGTYFVHDPGGMTTFAPITVDWWGLDANDDATLKSRLIDAIAEYVATDFDAALKVRWARIGQDSDDGGTIVVHSALTTTDEDVLNGAQGKTIDPKGIQSNTTAARLGTDFYTTGGQFASSDFVGGSTMAGGKIRGISHKELNDNEKLSTGIFGLTDTAEDILNRAMSKRVDPNAIASAATAAKISSDFTPLTSAGFASSDFVGGSTLPGGIFRFSGVSEINDGNALHTAEYGLRNTIGDVEYPGTRASIDSTGIASHVNAVKVSSDFTVPSFPSLGSSVPSSDFVVRDTLYERMNDGKTVTGRAWGVQTREQEIENRGTSVTRSIIAPTDGVVSVETQFATCSSGDTIVTLTEAAFDARLNTNGFRQVTGFKNTPTRYTIRATFVNDDMAIFVGRARKTRMVSPIDKSGTYVNIVEAFEAGNGNYRYTMGAFEFDRLTIPFTIRRWFTGITDPTDNFFVSFLNKTNNAPFLGFATGSVMLLSASFRDNLNNTMAHAVPVDFDLAADDFFWAITKAPRVGLRSLDPTGTITAANDYSATSISAQWATETPTQADLSFIIT